MKHIYLFIISLLLVAVVEAQPCNFTYTIVQANTVTFTPPAAYPNSQFYYHWDFGDGSSIFTVGANTHIYNQGGAFNVILDVYDTTTSAIVCTYTGSFTLTFCSFGYQQDSINPSVYNFWANNVPVNNTIEWNFGDGNTATGTNVTHGYTTAGTYTVYMSQIDSSGNSILCSTSFMVGFSFLLPCSFNVATTSASNIFTLDALVSSSLGTVIWDLGDTNIGPAYGYHMQVGYGNPGTYTICMTYISPAGDTCQYCQQVTATGGQNCSFTATPGVNPPNSYNFTGSGAPSSAIYLWNFADGNVATSIGNTITHIYNNPGVYLVCMDIQDTATGNILCSYCAPVMVNTNVFPCQANYTYANVGLTAYFINQSGTLNNPPYNYSWDFGDGGSSTVPFPQHIYSQPGTYWVCLNVSNSTCNNTFCDSVVIDTITNSLSCNAYFVFTSNAPYSVIGVNLSSGTNLNFAWDFGDGNTGTGAYPTHQYTSTGSFLVCLTISNFVGCTDTYCDTLSVDSLGNVYYKGVSTGFTLNIMSPADVTSGINEPAAGQISKLYPVPANDYLYVDWSSAATGKTTYEVISADGRKAVTGNLTGTNDKLYTGNLASGIYLLRIIGPDGRTDNKTFIKQ